MKNISFVPFYPMTAARKVCTNSMKVKYFPIKSYHKYDKINHSKLHIFSDYRVGSTSIFLAHLLKIGMYFIHIDKKEKISS